MLTEWLASLRGNTVGLDTAPLIYFLEDSPEYVSIVRPFFQALDRDDVKGVTSVLTLLEVLIHPLRRGGTKLADQYRRILLNAKGLTTVSLVPDVAEEAARLRATYNLCTPDAIQVATALWNGASFFFTNDARLPAIPGLRMLVLDELKAAQRILE